MQDLKINWVKATQTSTGKDKLDVSVTKGDGTTLDATIWAGFPNYASLAPGQTIQGKITSKDWKGKLYYSIQYDNPSTGTTAPHTGNKTAVMEKMMDKKAGQIASAQDSKEHSIRLSSTMRDAVLITTTQISHDGILSKDPLVIKKMIKDWRNWLLTNWDVTTNDFSPFPSSDEVDIDYGN